MQIYTLYVFLAIAAISTAIYIPILKIYGVSEKLLERSSKIGFYSTGILIGSSVVIDFLSTSQASKLSSFPGVVISTFFTGRMLKINLNIAPLFAYSTAFGVYLACMFIAFFVFFKFFAGQ